MLERQNPLGTAERLGLVRQTIWERQGNREGPRWFGKQGFGQNWFGPGSAQSTAGDRLVWNREAAGDRRNGWVDGI